MAKNRRNVRGLTFEFVDAHGYVGDRLGQRAKPPSPGGGMSAYAWNSGDKSATPSPTSPSEAAFEYEPSGRSGKVEEAEGTSGYGRFGATSRAGSVNVSPRRFRILSAPTWYPGRGRWVRGSRAVLVSSLRDLMCLGGKY